MVPVKVVILSDNARGADEYLALKKRGFKLQQLAFEPAEDR